MSQAPSSNYRVYCHDRSAKIVNAEWVDASSDEEAIAAVRARYSHFQCEIWDGNRLVAKMEANRLTA